MNRTGHCSVEIVRKYKRASTEMLKTISNILEPGSSKRVKTKETEPTNCKANNIDIKKEDNASFNFEIGLWRLTPLSTIFQLYCGNLNLGIVYFRGAFLIVHNMFDDEFNMEIEMPSINFVFDD